MTDEPRWEKLTEFQGFYKRYTSTQKSEGGLDLTLGVPREDVVAAIQLADTDGMMLRITVEQRVFPRLESVPAGPDDETFRVWTGQTDE